jgi:hypothetical protein
MLFPSPALWLYNVPYRDRFRHATRDFLEAFRPFVVTTADVFLWLAGPDDLVATTEEPDPGFLEYVGQKRGQVPRRFVVDDDGSDTIDAMIERHAERVRAAGVRCLVPFCQTERTHRMAQGLGLTEVFAPPALVDGFNRKREAYGVIAEAGLPLPPHAVCDSLAAVAERVRRLRTERGTIPLLVKEDESVGGGGIFALDTGFDDAALARLLAGVTYPLLVEERLPVAYSGNVQFLIRPSRPGDEDTIVPLGTSRQLLKEGIVHDGNRWPMTDDAEAARAHDEAGLQLAREMARRGYFGMVGFDAIWCPTVSPVLYPAVEINARFNLSTVALRTSQALYADRFPCFQSQALFLKTRGPGTQGPDFAAVRRRLAEVGLDPGADAGREEAVVVLSCAGLRHPIPTPAGPRARLMVLCMARTTDGLGRLSERLSALAAEDL